jgi:hypothetical protein
MNLSFSTSYGFLASFFLSTVSPLLTTSALAMPGLEERKPIKSVNPANPDKKVEFERLEREARGGNRQAQFDYAQMHATGDGVPINQKKALEFYEKAARQGHELAQNTCGAMYFAGMGTQPNPKKAFPYFAQAAKQGNLEAQANCARMLFHGRGTRINKKEAFKGFERVIDEVEKLGSACTPHQKQVKLEAQQTCATMLWRGDGIPKDKEKGLKYYKQAADQGLDKAQYDYALALLVGTIIPMDEEEGVEYIHTGQGYKKAGDHGLATAQYDGANIPLEETIRQGVEYLKKAADQGFVNAEVTYANLLFAGLGMSTDLKEALAYYKKAADKGDRASQYQCGVLYGNEEGNSEQALYYFNLAAMQEEPRALYNCYLLFSGNNGIQQDMKKALLYLSKAVRLGFPPALCDQGFRFFMGDEVPMNKKQAFEYFEQAAKQGNPNAHYCCAFMLSQGEGVQKNVRKALTHLQSAIVSAEDDLVFKEECLKDYAALLSSIDEDGKKVTRAYFKQMALQDNPYAQLTYAYLCGHGIGGPQEDATAITYYENLVNQGNTSAMFTFAQMWYHKNDLEKAYTYCEMAAKQDHIRALSWLPVLKKEKNKDFSESQPGILEIPFFPLEELSLQEIETDSSDEGDPTESQPIVLEANETVTTPNQESQGAGTHLLGEESPIGSQPVVLETKERVETLASETRTLGETKESEELSLSQESHDLILSAERLTQELIVYEIENRKQIAELKIKKQQGRMRQILKVDNSLGAARSPTPMKNEALRIFDQIPVSFESYHLLRTIHGQGDRKINTFKKENLERLVREAGGSVENKKGMNAIILSLPVNHNAAVELEWEIEDEATVESTETVEKATLHNAHGKAKDNNLYRAMLPHLKRFFTSSNVTPDKVRVK